AFQAGDIDAYTTNNPGAYKAATHLAPGEGQVITNENHEADETVLALNTSKPPFNDPIARQALASGIDQDDLSRLAFDGTSPPAWGLFEEGSPYYVSRAEAGYPTLDVDKARDLAAQYEKNHGSPLEFTLAVPAQTEQLAVAQALQAQAKAFGVNVTI